MLVEKTTTTTTVTREYDEAGRLVKETTETVDDQGMRGTTMVYTHGKYPFSVGSSH